VTAVRVEPYSIAVDDAVLTDLRRRIRNTRWPSPAPAEAWWQGADLDYMKELLGYWADGFDWRAQERYLNGFAHFRADIDGARVHFVHARAADPNGVPLILTHGWPSSFVEYLPVATQLADAGFDVVVPSLPGYAFSERPRTTGITTRHTAARWHKLMQALGYERYGAGGGDFGAGVATFMALDQPERMRGLHLTNLEVAPHIGTPLTDHERAYQQQQRDWDDVERGYSSIQSTKPQTVGYGLNDSPAGLAAWIAEKWRSWTGANAHPGRDFLLTTLTIYWATQTITETLRDYYDNRWHASAIGPGDRVQTPTAVAVFANERVPEGDPPREWVERLYNVQRWTPMPSGGHFAPIEEPDRVATDIAAFFSGR
jgi:pimeloyl-ACP methyl ester carboxylesterase